MERRYPALLPLLLFSLDSAAQAPFEHADQRTFQVQYDHCISSGSGWVVAGSFNEDTGAPGYGLLRAFDSEGVPTWEVILQDGFNQVYTAALTTLQGGDIINACNLIECDVLIPYFLVERRDANGAVIWTRQYAAWVGDVAANAGDSLAFSTDFGILITNTDGDSLTSFETPGFNAYDITWDTPGTLLISAYNGSLSRWSLDGTLLAQTQVPAPILDLCIWSGRRAVLAQDGLVRTFDAQLNAMDSVAVGPPTYYRGLLPLNDQLVVADNTISVVLDTAVSIVSSIGMDPAGEFPDELFSAFAVNDNAILEVGAATTAQRPAGLVRTVSLNGDFALHLENVGIEIVGFDSVYYEFMGGMVFTHADVTVRITNMAQTELNEVMVSHFLSSGPICGTAGTSMALENAGLDFGEFADVSLTGLYLNYGPWGWVNTDQLVCIGALSPNNLYDRDQSDNYACDTAHIVLGIQDPLENDLGLLLPNPFAGALDMIFITPSLEPLRATFFDATGRQLAATTISAGSTRFHWDLPGLNEGVHILHLEGRSTSTMRKLVHQRP